MKTYDILSLIVSVASLFLAIIAYSKIKINRARSAEVAFLLSVAINNLSLLLKKINDETLSFEIERNIRRISLFTDDRELFKKSLFWFKENGNLDDQLMISRAAKLSFKKKKTINSIIKRHKSN